MTVLVKKIGGSVAVVIPKAMAREMGLRDGTPLELAQNAGAITLRPGVPRPRRSLRSIVKQIDPASYQRHHRELGNISPVGKEIW